MQWALGLCPRRVQKLFNVLSLHIKQFELTGRVERKCLFCIRFIFQRQTGKTYFLQQNVSCNSTITLFIQFTLKKYNLQYVGSIRFTNQKFITCSQFQVTQDKGYTPWAFGLRFVRQVRWLFELLRRFVKNCPRIQKVHLLLTCIGRLDHGAAYKLLCLLVLYLSCLVANGPYFRPFTSQNGPKPMATFESFENNLFFLVKCL